MIRVGVLKIDNYGNALPAEIELPDYPHKGDYLMLPGREAPEEWYIRDVLWMPDSLPPLLECRRSERLPGYRKEPWVEQRLMGPVSAADRARHP